MRGTAELFGGGGDGGSAGGWLDAPPHGTFGFGGQAGDGGQTTGETGHDGIVIIRYEIQ